jgi:hypothetical protein
LNEVLEHPESKVLVIHGDRDEFTSHAKYQEWISELRGNVEVVEVENGAHFWLGSSGGQLIEAVERWLP